MTVETYEPELPIDKISIGMSQTRSQIAPQALDELAQSIAVQGLLEPIIVFRPNSETDEYEVIAGQRRFLACSKLGHSTIKALIREAPKDEFDAKGISLTENLLREDPSQADKIDVCTKLYNHYGTLKIVADKTGIPYRKVQEYVKSARLIPEMKELISQGYDVGSLLRAQDAATDDDGNVDVKAALAAASQFKGMSGAQQKKVVKKREEDPDADIEDLIDKAKTGEKITQIVVTISAGTHTTLKSLASSQGTTLDDMAGTLLEQALATASIEEEEG